MLRNQFAIANVVSATLIARIKITSAQGAVATVQTRINLQPLMTTLVATPGLVQAGAVRGDLLRDLVALQHVLERVHLEAQLVGGADEHEDLVGAVAVGVDETPALEDLDERLELQIAARRQHVLAGLQFGAPHQHVPGGQEDERRRRRLDDVGQVHAAPRLGLRRGQQARSGVRAPGVVRGLRQDHALAIAQRPDQRGHGNAGDFQDFHGASGGNMERVMGIEPTLVAWEATVLPLNYTRGVVRF